MRIDYGSNLLIKPLFSYFFSSLQNFEKTQNYRGDLKFVFLYFFFGT